MTTREVKLLEGYENPINTPITEHQLQWLNFLCEHGELQFFGQIVHPNFSRDRTSLCIDFDKIAVY